MSLTNGNPSPPGEEVITLFPTISTVSVTSQLASFWSDPFVLWAMVLVLSLSLGPRLWGFVKKIIRR
jgi:hypothetical protein